jgi:benzoylsuccinyl-CoA thiolase BbsA subunit
LSRRGRIYSATDVFIGQPSMREYAPLIVGYVDLPEGIRIFAQLDGEIGRFRCDDEVEPTTGPVRNNPKGEPISSYKFKKIEQFLTPELLIYEMYM